MRRGLHEIDASAPGAPSRCLLGAGALAALPELLSDLPAAAVVDRRPARLHAAVLRASLVDGRGRPLPRRTLAGGETVKTLDEFARLQEWLADRALPRDGALVGVGGGTLLDLTGLAAATWTRGVAWLAAPTTLLAMVDASVGGKTGVNVAGVKNAVGTFHAPRWIVADPSVLASLPRSEWRNGLAELVKTACIGDPALFRTMHRRRAQLAAHFACGRADRPPAGALSALPWTEWIGRSVRVKAAVVAADYREAGGRRVLNLGHTLGHALEPLLGLGHGAAVALGMAAAARIARCRGLLDPDDAQRLCGLLQACGLPVTATPPPAPAVARLLLRDKKRRGGSLPWLLPRRPGLVEDGHPVALDEALAALRGDLP